MSSQSSCVDCKLIVPVQNGRCSDCNTLLRVDGVNASLQGDSSDKLQCLCCRNFKSPNAFHRAQNPRGRQKYCKICHAKALINANDSDDDILIIPDEPENDSDYSP